MRAAPSSRAALARAAELPELGFEVRAVRPLAHVAVPTLSFELAVTSIRGHAIRSVLLDVQLQIAARRRSYDDDEQEALIELFGTSDRWGSTLATVPWTRVTAVVPEFEDRALVQIPVTCTYDLEVKESRYLNAVSGGTVPVELLFNGTIFYTGADGALQTALIGWDKEAAYDLPAGVWREALDLHFPGAAWLRLGRESFDRLTAYRSRRQLAGWDETIESLLPPEVR
jgi:Family of unknown function (DUF6084)